MVDRLSTLQIFQSGISTILERQTELARTQQELSTGRRILSPSDDPAGAVRVLDIEEDLRQIDQYQRNASAAEGQLAFSDTTLGSVTDLLQRVRELSLQANNATIGPEGRAAIAVELDSRLEELVSIANTRDANDEFIFAGFQAQSQPFSQNGGVVTYSGDDGQRFIDISAGSQVAVRDSGSSVFLAVPAGNGSFDFSVSGNTGTAVVSNAGASGSFVRDNYSINFIQALPTDPVTYEVVDSGANVVATGNYAAGEAISFNGATLTLVGEPADGDSVAIDSTAAQSMFTTVREIADALRTSSGSPANDAQINNTIASGLLNLDQALGNVLNIQAEVGSRLNRIDSQQAINDDFNVQLQTSLSEVQDVDFAEAISRLNLQQVALQAAQQTFVTVQRLSLFDYIR